jgi:hypothetical protein
MKRAIFAMLVLAGCGGSGSSGPNLSNFEGTWPTGNLTITVNCGGSTATQNSTASIGIGPGSGSDLQYTSNDGCLYKFNVSGSTATLSNAPVTCSTTQSGTTYVLTVNSYTATTSDGHNLTLTGSGTITSGSSTCSYAITGHGTR